MRASRCNSAALVVSRKLSRSPPLEKLLSCRPRPFRAPNQLALCPKVSHSGEYTETPLLSLIKSGVERGRHFRELAHGGGTFCRAVGHGPLKVSVGSFAT
jgi:hypothetical protein